MTADKVKKEHCSREYCSNCLGCKISQGEPPPAGGAVLKLNGNWILNHYGGKEGFLGWLALQPYKHRTHLKDLNDKESSSLGPNIKKINKALRAYWAENFNKDPIERIYVACFSEYSDGHLHFHVIPRTRKMYDLKKSKLKRDRLIAWNIYVIYDHEDFPEGYVVRTKKPNDNVEKFMDYLLKRIPKAKRVTRYDRSK